MTDSSSSQNEPSPLTRMTAKTAQGFNGLTYWGSTIASYVTGGAGLLFGLGGALLSGGALLVGAVAQNLLARDADRARDDIDDALHEGDITGPQSAHFLLAGLGRTALAPLLLAFNLSATLPPFLVDVAIQKLNDEQQTTPQAEKGARQNFPQPSAPEKKLAPARPLTLSARSLEYPST